MITTVVPSLTRDGYIDNPVDTMRKIFKYYLVSEYSQSNTFRGKVVSIKYDIEQGESPDAIVENIRASLLTIYERYFDVVDIVVNTIESTTTSKITLKVDVTVTINNNTYALSSSVSTTNNLVDDVNQALNEIYIT
jgi:predicted RNase H-like HicB family nuclease